MKDHFGKFLVISLLLVRKLVSVGGFITVFWMKFIWMIVWGTTESVPPFIVTSLSLLVEKILVMKLNFCKLCELQIWLIIEVLIRVDILNKSLYVSMTIVHWTRSMTVVTFVHAGIGDREFSVYVATLLRATKHLFPTEILTLHLCELENVRLSEFPLTACFQN